MGSCENCANSLIGPKDIPIPFTNTNKNEEMPDSKGAKDNLIIHKIQKKTISNIPGLESNAFENKILEEINLLRTSPEKYAEKLSDAKNKIYEENGKFYYYGNDDKKYFMESGKDSINEAIKELKKIKPMIELKWDSDLKVDLFEYSNEKPKIHFTEKELFESIQRQRAKVKDNYNNCYFSVDYGKDPEMIILFILISNNQNAYKKNIILDPSITNFAVAYNEISGRIFTSVSTYA